MENSHTMDEILQLTVDTACHLRNEYITPEHMLYSIVDHPDIDTLLTELGVNCKRLTKKIKEFLNALEKSNAKVNLPVPSVQMGDVMRDALKYAASRKSETIDVKDYVMAILEQKESQAAYLLGTAIEGKEKEFIAMLDIMFDGDTNVDTGYAEDGYAAEAKPLINWRQLVTNVTEASKTHTPLIGREAELDRTIQVLCRMEKNNPLHVGDPGVGKTALIYGLATMIRNGNVPEKLRSARIYSMDMGQLLAGAQYRGDFEKRLRDILEGAAKENAILYLDEIHNIMGAGRGSDGGPDASNILKPYLESGKIRFIGATTHEEYNRKLSKDAAITRRFQTIDIIEPSIDETIKIVEGLQPSLQKCHHVTYRKEALEYAVRASAKHISGRFLPDKAIDLIDEAGAYLEVHPNIYAQRSYVTKALIDEILVKVCKIQASALKDEDNESLKDLRYNMLSKIFGQTKAVDEVTEAVMMAKAGLTDDDKPLASLLFVGPTGVGKTEVARVLAKELGVELVRFDMSEYTEKHAVAKLIGSPAGYVGYEDGGLLTDAIRRTPNCVLLLDEIEKAHSDIYNILLQVMDYARLTDNRGQKADFRNVILIMTSNAGAQYASQASIGFAGGVSRGEAMMKQVKKTFKPEFINRLSDIVVFNDMTKDMASRILSKKLRELSDKVKDKEIQFEISDAAFNLLLTMSFTREYGARETDRVIARELKPLLMRQILFGKKKKGTTKLSVDCMGDKIFIR